MKNLYILISICILLYNCSSNDSVDEVETTCSELVFEGDLEITTQEQLDEFGRQCYTSINGSVSLGRFNELSNISSLKALVGLESITGNLFIKNLTDLENLEGLNNLETVGGLGIYIVDTFANDPMLNDGVKSLRALSQLKQTEYLLLDNLDGLESLSGLENLRSNNEINLTDNDNLQNIGSLAGVETTNYNNIIINRNPKLTSLSGLEHIVSVEGGIVIANILASSLQGLDNLNSAGFMGLLFNANLTDLSNLSNLETVGSDGNIEFQIAGNVSLESLQGLESLTDIEILIIESQPLLRDLCGLQNVVNNGEFQEIIISENGYNPTIEDIANGNCQQ